MSWSWDALTEKAEAALQTAVAQVDQALDIKEEAGELLPAVLAAAGTPTGSTQDRRKNTGRALAGAKVGAPS